MELIPTEQGVHRLAIREVLANHSRAADRLDEALLSACYWPDASVSYSFYEGPVTDFVPLVIGLLKEKFALTRHTLNNHLARFEGQLCYSETQVTAQHLSHSRQEDITQFARYLDTFECREERWRLKHRVLVTDWVQRQCIENIEDEPGIAEFTRIRSTHDRSDPSYAIPSLAKIP